MTSRPTYNQIEAFVGLLEINPAIAKGHTHSAQGKIVHKKKWEEIANTLNSMGGAIKDTKGWMKYWINKKFYLKKIVGQRNQSARRTGGGIDPIQQLDPLEERMVSVLGGDTFATGDPGVSVPLNIPQTSEERQEMFTISVESSDPQQPSTSGVSTLFVPTPSPQRIPMSSPQATPRRHRLTMSSPQLTPRVLQVTGRSPRVTPIRRQIGPQRRNQLQIERDRLIGIEEKRVEAERQHGEGLNKIASSIDSLAESIRELVAMWHSYQPAMDEV